MQRMEWEKPYLKELIDTLSPTQRVLEVGFANGIAASFIQSFRPTSHTLIEKDPQVAEQARLFAKDHPTVQVIEKPWQEALSSLGTFEAIFFNEPLFEMSSESVRNEAKAYLQKEKELFQTVYATLPNLKQIRYSDSDLEELFQSAHLFGLEYLPQFLAELKFNQQITQEQYDKFHIRHNLVKTESPHLSHMAKEVIDPTFLFLKECLKSHVKKGTRITFFSNNPTSKFEDPLFFDLVIASPNYDYTEKTMKSGASSCPYYPFQEALVPLIICQV